MYELFQRFMTPADMASSIEVLHLLKVSLTVNQCLMEISLRSHKLKARKHFTVMKRCVFHLLSVRTDQSNRSLAVEAPRSFTGPHSNKKNSQVTPRM